MTTTNDVILEGIIVHKFVTSQIAILTINTGNATLKPNFPKVLFFGDIIETINKDYNVKDQVKILGNIQSSRYKPGIKNQNTISIFGEGIEHSKPIPRNVPGFENPIYHYNFMNEIKIAGTVMNIEKTFRNLIKIKVLTHKNGRISFVTMAYYTDNPDKLLNEIKKDDFVNIIGCVQTSKKEVNGETRHFENYVATAIAKSKG